jgi:hypothetical protein
MIKKICVDDYGTQWYEAIQPSFVKQRFPSYVYGYDFDIGYSWYQVCIIETYIHWGLFSKEEAESEGFNLRW